MDKQELSNLYDELSVKVSESIDELLKDSVEYAQKEGFSKSTIPVSIPEILSVCSVDVFKSHLDSLDISCRVLEEQDTVNIDIS